ncbi:unnamed protein product [Vicia faba]|uniref:Tf2-1-like SH3-like domain-containing protein n=1 Tax=Vicia faba TaxID=3906 RepID=A0AAV1AGY4_VICFA|nr:unnamed protein product [Vicia faba]
MERKKDNLNRRDFTFQEGDFVWLKLQPYRQITVAHRVSQKLARRYFGPFRVIKRVGYVVYHLELPSSSRIRPVVHVSLLKPYHGSTPATYLTSLPPPDCIPYTYPTQTAKPNQSAGTTILQEEEDDWVSFVTSGSYEDEVRPKDASTRKRNVSTKCHFGTV